jgi:hypothetical protein
MPFYEEHRNMTSKAASPSVISNAKTTLITVLAISVFVGLFGCGSPPGSNENPQLSGTETTNIIIEDDSGADESGATDETEPAVNEVKEAVGLEDATTGDIVHLGEISFTAYNAGKKLQQSNDYGWLVLAVEGNKVLLITENVIDKRPYSEKHVDVSWESSSIRKWLNTEFYELLPANIKDRIVETDIVNDENADYGTSGGNATKDRIFLLSADEAKSYFSSDDQRESNLEVRGDSENTAVWCWWLRSPGSTGANAVVVGGPILFDDRGATEKYSDGRILLEGEGVNRSIGVRPVFWLERQ